jgi:hypothetical protein
VSPSVGERAERITQERLFPDLYPWIGTSRPLQALREEIEERLSKNWRDVRLRLLPSESKHKSLAGIGLTCARLFNKLNYEKKQAFFKEELMKVKMYEIDKKYYCEYNETLGVNAQAVIQKNDETWNAFYELLKLRKTGKATTAYQVRSPPGYWKDRLTGKKEIHIPRAC